MRFERHWLTAAIAAVLAGCAGSIPDEPANGADELWEGEAAGLERHEVPELLRVSVERVAGQLGFAFEYCLDGDQQVPVYEITVTEESDQRRVRCRATSKAGADPPAISRWTFGDASAFDVKGCEPLEPNRGYTVRVEASTGCFSPEGSKRFEVREDGSTPTSGDSCREYPRMEDAPTSAP